MAVQAGESGAVVLLVDGDRPAADRRADELAALRPDWVIHSAAGFGEASLTLHSLPTLDAIVTTTDLPDGDPVTLLEAVTNRRPKSLRLVIGEGAFDTDRTDFTIVHRYLGTTVPTVEVCAAIERSYELQRRLGDPGVMAIIDSLGGLPSPPDSIVELDHLLGQPDTSFDGVAVVIASDPAMTAKLLQLVNSAYFGLTQRITNVGHAVSVLGIDAVRNLLYSVEMMRAFSVARADLGEEVERLHDHSLAVADLARRLMTGTNQSHDAFAAGMMHDVGMLAVIAGMPDRFVALRDEVTLGGKELHHCEHDILGTSHAFVGAYLLDHWGLPEVLVEAVARSHDAADLPAPIMAPVHAVYVAEQVLTVLGENQMFWEHSEPMDEAYLNALGIGSAVTQMLSGSRIG